MRANNNALLFLLGLAVGLLAGAGFFIFKMDELLKNINLFKSKKDTLIISHETGNEKTVQSGRNDYQKYFSNDTRAKTITSAALLAKKYSNETSVKKVMAEADSLLADTPQETLSSETSLEKVVLRKDELLQSRSIPVVYLDTIGHAALQGDTMPEFMSGIKNAKNISASMQVEFWKSPVNYRGYKMTKNKIVLFGISPSDTLQLFLNNEVFFLKQQNAVFQIRFTDEFRQFEPISNAELISKMKK